MRVNTDNSIAWTFTPPTYNPWIYSIALDGQGYIFVVEGSTIFKLNSDTGVIENSHEIPRAEFKKMVVVGNDLYLAGSFSSSTVNFNPEGMDLHSSNGFRSGFVTKLDTNFNYHWTRSFGGEGNDSSNAVAVGANGEVYVSGGFNKTVNFNSNINNIDPEFTLSVTKTAAAQSDLFIAKFDANGGLVWVRQQDNSPHHSYSIAGNPLEVDYDGNIRVADGVSKVFTYTAQGVLSNETSLDDSIYNSKVKIVDIASSSSKQFSVVVGYFTGGINFDSGNTDDNKVSLGGRDGFIRFTDDNEYRTTIQIGGAGNAQVGAADIDDNGYLTVVGFFNDSVDFDHGPEFDVVIEENDNAQGLGLFISRYLIYPLDSDHDGMPTQWELTYGLDPNISTDANIDSDGDHTSNLDEFLNGSNPRDPNSCLGTLCDRYLAEEPSRHVENLPQPSDSSDSIGSIGGIFKVDGGGGATYSIPIFSLPGRTGVAPDLSFNYSSQAGNGLLGQGWSIGGLSQITRCKRTLSSSGEISPLNYEDSDFCLDGQHLVLIDGVYGENDSQYKTELDSDAIVTLYGSGYPDYFKVERKDGSTSDYFAIIGTNYTQRLAWGITSYSDSTGNNSISYSYEPDTTDHKGQRIKEIGYDAGNGRIEFEYKTRNDLRQAFAAGVEVVTDTLLKSVTVSNEGDEVRKYNITYEGRSSGDFLSPSRIRFFEECVNYVCLPRTTFTWARAASTLGFEDKRDMNFMNGGSHEHIIAKPGDINGDGFMDLIYTRTDRNSSIRDRLYYALSDGEELHEVSEVGDYGLPRKSPFGFHVIDYNGDGYQDVLRSSGNQWVVHLSDGEQLATSFVDTEIPNDYEDKAIVVDFNSDGLPDILYEKGDALFGVRYMEQVESPDVPGLLENRFNIQEHDFDFSTLLSRIPRRSDEPGFQYRDHGYIGWDRTFDGFTTPRVADFNGDGKADILAVINSRYWIKQSVVLGEEIFDNYKTLVIITINDDSSFVVQGSLDLPSFHWETVQRYHPSSAFDVELVDLNNDGLTDIVSKIYNAPIESLEYTLRVHINKGTPDGGAEFLPPQSLGVIPNANFTYFADMNHDGYLDLLYPPEWDANMVTRLWHPRLSSFNTDLHPTNLHFTGKDTNLYLIDIADTYVFMDINGDSYNDAVHLELQTGMIAPEKAIYPSKLSDGPVNVIENIDNGFGNQTTIHYDTLTNSDLYSKEFDAMSASWNLPDGTHTFGKNAKGSDNYLAVFDLKMPGWVVSSVESTAPLAGTSPGNVDLNAVNRISYHYSGAKAQAGGRGVLGFRQIKSLDEQSGVETTTTYRQDYPFTGYPLETVVHSTADAGRLLKSTTNDWRLQGWDGDAPVPVAPYRPYLYKAVERNYALNDGKHLSTIKSTTEIDNAGNVLTMQIGISDEVHNNIYNQRTENEYGLTDYDKRFGRLSSSTVRHSRSGKPEIVRSSRFAYHTIGPQKGLLYSETVESNIGNDLRTTYNYDDYGNKTRISSSGSQGKNGSGGNQYRSQTFEYNDYSYDEMRFLQRTYNGFGQLELETLSRDSLGQPTRTRYMSGVITELVYGVFGREYFRRDSTGAFSYTTYESSHSDCPIGTQYAVSQRNAGGSEQLVCFDVLGRDILNTKPLFDGSWVAVASEYDQYNRLKHKSNPYPLGTSPMDWTTMHYDTLGRVTLINHPIDPEHPSQSVSSNIFDGFTAKSTNRKGQLVTQIKNAYDEVVSTEDALGSLVYNDYDSTGNLLSVTTTGTAQAQDEPANISVFMEYDDLGNKISMNDPDMGYWEYDYNAFGEMVEQRDNKGQRSVMTYDSLTRLTGRAEYKANGTLEGMSIWSFVTENDENGLGKLKEVSRTQDNYLKKISYDEFSRPKEVVTLLEGVFGLTKEKTTYDQFGRVYQTFDAAGDYTQGHYAGTQNEYNEYGYLSRVLDVVNESGNQHEHYAIAEMDYWGNVTREITNGKLYSTTNFYNSVTSRLDRIVTVGPMLNEIQNLEMNYDVLGNLTKRTDHMRSHVENFDYDDINRLEWSQVVGEVAQNVGYDSYGNIKTKTGVGTYTYGQAANAGPHAISGIAGATSASYNYDANGNLTEDSNGRSIIYSTYNKPTVIQKGGHRTDFSYRPDRSRYKRVDTSNGETTITLYFGNTEKITRPNGSLEIKRYVGASTLITLHYSENGFFERSTTDLLFKDHLGSVNAIVDENGGLTPLSFDAWGMRRNALTWRELNESTKTTFDTVTTTRGFTDHEMLDAVGLIHMNGRVYDASIGRFMSPDFFVQDPGFTQSYNRYSYVYNNPLTHTDPSGHFVQFLAMLAMSTQVGRVVKGTEFGFLTTLTSIVGCSSGDVAQCTAMTMGFNYAATGDVEKALKAGVATYGAAAAFEGIGRHYDKAAMNSGVNKLNGLQKVGKIAWHAAVGGVSSVLLDGKFGHGFVSAGISQSVSGYVNNIDSGTIGVSLPRAFMAAMVGGTVSSKTGGKFANGAFTAALGRMFNDDSGAAKLQRFKLKKHLLRSLEAEINANGDLKLSLAVSDIISLKYNSETGEFKGEYELRGIKYGVSISGSGFEKISGGFSNATISISNFTELGFDASLTILPYTVGWFDLLPRTTIEANFDFKNTRAYRRGVKYRRGSIDKIRAQGIK
ncbi:MAG: VCBS repeat-containing protein [Pseudomonadales bacterium]|nr:VCBS repeat-containing protein [Pseudomonadales bacterium]